MRAGAMPGTQSGLRSRSARDTIPADRANARQRLGADQALQTNSETRSPDTSCYLRTNGEQHAWRAAGGTAGLSAHCPVLCQVARKSGAVGRSATLVSHRQRGTAKISARPITDPARTPAAGLTPPTMVANRDANCRRDWSELPDLG